VSDSQCPINQAVNVWLRSAGLLRLNRFGSEKLTNIAGPLTDYEMN
jgi:hypothetical protein